MIKGMAGKESYDIVFIDPPYKDKVLPEALTMLLKTGVVNENTKIICESGDQDIFYGDEELKSKFDIVKQARYSISYITVLTPRQEI